jgi:hypothetical protein
MGVASATDADDGNALEDGPRLPDLGTARSPPRRSPPCSTERMSGISLMSGRFPAAATIRSSAAKRWSAGCRTRRSATPGCATWAVVADTIGKAVTGEESSNDTWKNLAVNTTRPLALLGATWVQLDHIGHDKSTEPELAARMGHGDAAFTQRRYVHALESERSAEVSKLADYRARARPRAGSNRDCWPRVGPRRTQKSLFAGDTR